MKDRWDTFSISLETDFEDTFLFLEAKFEDSQKTSKEALKSLHELVDKVSTTNTPGTQEEGSMPRQPEWQPPKPVSTFKPSHSLPNSANLTEFLLT